MYNEKIIVAQISLHYESRGTILHEWTRERYCREQAERGKNYPDWYFVRVSQSKADQIQKETFRETARRKYDKAIMSKYSVSANYRQDRYFMEQIRPTI